MRIPINYCSCGRKISGNGGKAAHAKMHQRNNEWRQALQDGVVRYRWLTLEDFEQLKKAS